MGEGNDSKYRQTGPNVVTGTQYLQFVSDSHEYGLDMVSFTLVFSARLKQWHVIFISESLSLIGGDLN